MVCCFPVAIRALCSPAAGEQCSPLSQGHVQRLQPLLGEMVKKLFMESWCYLLHTGDAGEMGILSVFKVLWLIWFLPVGNVISWLSRRNF